VLYWLGLRSEFMRANTAKANYYQTGNDAESSTALAKATRPLLRVTRPENGEYFWIHRGKQGSLQTAWQMARLVREDTIRDEGLQRWAAQLLINAGLDSHSDKRAILGLLLRTVHGLAYIHDPAGAFDAVSSARQTLAKGSGDCDDLSVLLATLMSLLGFQPRFVLARYKEKTKGYDHIYVDTVLPNGERVVLDPSAQSHGLDWESSKAIERLTFPIFAAPIATLGDALQLATTGAAIGLNFVPVVGPILAALVGPLSSLFSRTQQRTEEKTRDEWKDQVYQGLSQIQAAVDSCKITRDQGTQAARELISSFYQACDQFTKSSVAQSCRNFETQDVPGGAQEGAFKTRSARIAQSGGSCSLTGAGTGNALDANAGNALMSAASSLPMLLLVAGGIFLASKFLK
jgi:Transglutaminase-like superfamily